MRVNCREGNIQIHRHGDDSAIERIAVVQWQ